MATTPANLKSYIFPAYLGGRNEIFKMGTHESDEHYTLWSQDINSSYPNQMREIANNITNVVFHPQNFDFKNRKNWLAKCSVFHTPKIPIGKLGVRSNDTVVFPTGSFNTWLFDFEYDDTIEILDVECVIEFDTVDISEYTLQLYDQRIIVGKKTPFGEVIKLILNSGYGRFAMKQLRATTCLVQDVKEFKDKFHISLTYGQGQIYAERVMQKAKDKPWFNINMESRNDADVNYITAARITAKARLYLYEKFVELYNLGCILLYTDTDSIYYLRPNTLPPPINETHLGGWDAERLYTMTIKGLKVYSYTCDKIDKDTGKVVGVETKYKYKGVHKPDSLDAEQKLKVWCRKGLEIYTSDIVKTSSFAYKKGIVNPETNIVTPIHNKWKTQSRQDFTIN